MSLDVASSIARQALIASQFQIALSSRNVAAADDPSRSATSGVLATTVDGGVRISAVRRAEDVAIYTRMIAATAATAERDAVLTHLSVLAQAVGDPQNGTSIGAMIGDLEAALADYANAPDDPLFGRTVVERARDVADELNRATNEILAQRETADRAIGDAVDTVNSLLARFHEVNTAIVKDTAAGKDVTMDLDRRDAIVAQISEHLGVSVMRREGNDMALFTDGGVSLYDRSPREVSFTRTPVFSGGAVGNRILVDGLPITGPGAPMPSRTGSIVGHALIRDEVLPTFELQMNEIAREITVLFQDGPGSLFTNGGGPDFAASLAVSAAVDPAQGGTVEMLRDGTGNPAGDAAYADRLLALGDALRANTAFDPATGLSPSASLLDFATETAGWVESLRQSADEDVRAEAAILVQTSDALSRETGVNLDDEFARQLMIERSFAASSRLIGMIDEMYETLIGIV